MQAFNWQLLSLRNNPFSVFLSEDPKDVRWVGMYELKKQIEQKLLEAIQSTATQVILCRGLAGTGKTHAMLYYTLLDHWPIGSGSSTQNVLVIPVRVSKESDKPDKNFYTDVLEQLGMSQIRQAVATAFQEIGEQASLLALQKITGSESLGKAVWMLGTSNDPIQNDFPKSNIRSERKLLLDSYFLDGCTREELRQLGLPRNIDTVQDQFRVLTALFHCFIGLNPAKEVARHNRVCLWIDEIEELSSYTSSRYRLLAQGLSDLAHHVPHFLSIWMNLTLTHPDEPDAMGFLVGEPLASCITDRIVFRTMTTDQGVQYVQELMRLWRMEQPETLKLPPSYPFGEDALWYLLETLGKRTPRSINKRCYNALAAALREHRVDEKGQIEVNLRFVRTITRAELDRD